MAVATADSASPNMERGQTRRSSPPSTLRINALCTWFCAFESSCVGRRSLGPMRCSQKLAALVLPQL